MGQPLGSQGNLQAGDREPKRPWDAKAVPAEAAEWGFPHFGGEAAGGRSAQACREQLIFIFFFFFSWQRS